MVMASQMLILFAIMMSHAQQEGNEDSESSQKAVAVCFFFLFVIYGSFAGMLTVFRNDIIKTENYSENYEVEDSESNTI